MEWLVQVVGDDYDVERLTKAFIAANLTITKIKGEYIVKSKIFNTISDSNKIQKEANRLLGFINGYATLMHGMQTPLGVGRITLVKDDGSTKVYVDATPYVRVRMISQDQKSELTPDIIRVADYDENVGKVLRLMGSPRRDQASLYKIYEVIENDVGGENNIIEKCWATKKAIDRFTRTVNSPLAIGDDARHGVSKTNPPKNPMSFVEAKSFIEGITRNWLIQRKNPIINGQNGS